MKKDPEKQNELVQLCSSDFLLTEKDSERLGQLVLDVDIDWMSPKQLSKFGNNALFLLCSNYKQNNLSSLIEWLLGKNLININQRDKYGNNALLLACWNYGNQKLIDAVRVLIRYGIEVNCQNKYGMNAVLLLRQFYRNPNQLEIIEVLIDAGFDVNRPTKYGKNALLSLMRVRCISENIVAMTQLLVNSKIDVNCLENGSGYNALMSLFWDYGNIDLLNVTKLLISRGIDVNHVGAEHGGNSNNVLLIVCGSYKMNNIEEVVQFLISSGMDLNHRDSSGRGALMNLVVSENKKSFQVLKLLISNGADVNLKDIEGGNILLYVCDATGLTSRMVTEKPTNLLDVLKLLIGAGIEINGKRWRGENALMLICESHQGEDFPEIVHLLVSNGIDVDCRDKEGKSVLDRLIQNKKQTESNLLAIKEYLIKIMASGNDE